MIASSSPILAVLLSLAGWLAPTAEAPGERIEPVRRMIVRDEVLIHVPIRHRPVTVLDWVERKGPKCLPSGALRGATMAGPSAIDFVLVDRRRVRAKLDSDCDGLDFYGGFYVEPRDGAICAKRDEIRSRIGGSCRIERFRALALKPRK